MGTGPAQSGGAFVQMWYLRVAQNEGDAMTGSGRSIRRAELEGELL
jgi:hypothetical protein